MMAEPLRIRADLSQREVVALDDEPWRPSPLPGVDRRMLDRVGDEVARATSVVRYQPGSSFDAHTHDLGEEFYVLDGVFSDEHGDFPAGSYVRNPPGSSHAPFTRDGCTIFVKLRQFERSDTELVVVDTGEAEFRPGLVPGLRVLPLHECEGVSTALVRWA
ncbi:MAG: cupin domain-containing protein, partial [Myxococcota bacterium]